MNSNPAFSVISEKKVLKMPSPKISPQKIHTLRVLLKLSKF